MGARLTMSVGASLQDSAIAHGRELGPSVRSSQPLALSSPKCAQISPTEPDSTRLREPSFKRGFADVFQYLGDRLWRSMTLTKSTVIRWCPRLLVGKSFGVMVARTRVAVAVPLIQNLYEAHSSRYHQSRSVTKFRVVHCHVNIFLQMNVTLASALARLERDHEFSLEVKML